MAKKMKKKNKKKYLNIGTVMKSIPDEDADENAPDRFYLKLGQNRNEDGEPFSGDELFPITLANGMVIEDGECLTMFSKKEQFARKVKDGDMDKKQASYLSGFLKYDVCLAVDPEELADEDDQDDKPKKKVQSKKSVSKKAPEADEDDLDDVLDDEDEDDTEVVRKKKSVAKKKSKQVEEDDDEDDSDDEEDDDDSLNF
jgi:hypothetical protein